ncbi:MAG: metallophosphoesterase [Holophagaceae bacterium]|nr:metallophosphoesterase [Holophagaceae bacterium]
MTLTLDGLQADTAYTYRITLKTAQGSAASPEGRFHTARPVGSTFSFCVQADSHLDENSDLAVYQRTLGNVAADMPDFHIDLGDTFMCEKHSLPLTAVLETARDEGTVRARYAYERGNFGLVAPSAPLFLVNGNHEGEAGWMANGTGQSLAVWTANARKTYYANPVPDAFYTGDASATPFVGLRASYYAWTWGDALFVVLDPFWHSTRQPSQNGWNLTLGNAQYAWLQQTLAGSGARYKFVFIHNLVGGLDGQMRGGIEAAPYFEWGGLNPDGSLGFAANRPGWTLPIHELLVQNGVTAVFHGHDHLYAKQVLDGIVYQEVPQPSAVNFQSGPSLATAYHYTSGTILSSSGHLRVTVSPAGVTAKYVRAWLPGQESATRKNGQVDDVWTVPALAARRQR